MNKKEKDEINKCIRAGLGFKETKEALAKQGITKDFHTSFYRMQQAIFPENARSDALHTLGEKKRQKDKPSLLSPHGSWSKTKQKEADDSAFAQVLNDAVFHLVPCPQKGLTIEDVREINLGGAITATVSYYTNINLNHPLLILVTRAILLVIKVKTMCYQIREKVNDIKAKGEKLWSPPKAEE